MTDDYEDTERDEFAIKRACLLIDAAGPVLIAALGTLSYSAQRLAMGTIIADWANTLGDKRDEALKEIHIYAQGYRPPQ